MERSDTLTLSFQFDIQPRLVSKYKRIYFDYVWNGLHFLCVFVYVCRQKILRPPFLATVNDIVYGDSERVE